MATLSYHLSTLLLLLLLLDCSGSTSFWQLTSVHEAQSLVKPAVLEVAFVHRTVLMHVFFALDSSHIKSKFQQLDSLQSQSTATAHLQLYSVGRIA